MKQWIIELNRTKANSELLSRMYECEYKTTGKVTNNNWWNNERELTTKNDAESNAIEHEQNWREIVDQPNFARVKYRGVCQEASGVMLWVSFLFSWFIRDLLEPKEPSSSFLASHQPCSALPVVFQDHKDSVMTAAGILQVPITYSRDILQQTKGGHLERVYSDQMVLEMIRQERLVR
jgi:hypothetical protein